jgi:hypothetical protein
MSHTADHRDVQETIATNKRLIESADVEAHVSGMIDGGPVRS